MKNLLLTLGLTVVTVAALAKPATPESTPDPEYRQAQVFVGQKNYAKASEVLFHLNRTTKDAKLKSKSAYLLSLCLFKLKLYQAASFSLIQVVRLASDPESTKSALELLLQTSDILNEPSLVRYAVKSTTPDRLSPSTSAVYHFLKGKIFADKGDTNSAKLEFTQALTENPKRLEILYALGLLGLKSNDTEMASLYFNKILELTANLPMIDNRRGMAILSMGRTHYQAKKWKQSIEFYRQIPKDSSLYRESLMELSWALFRNGQFRSALSPLQTLHSDFYENFYDPESLLLRSIITLFSCRYEEVEKILESFDTIYRPAYTQIETWIQGSPSIQDAYETFEKVMRAGPKTKSKVGVPDGPLPFFVVRSIADEPNVASELKYRKALDAEEKVVSTVFPQKGAPIASYMRSIIKGRRKASSGRLAHAVLEHLEDYEVNLADFISRSEFVHYEMLNSMREALKRKMDVTRASPIDRSFSRSFYVQNGYRYWPFEGEYWRDEVGNYQFVGKDQCEMLK